MQSAIPAHELPVRSALTVGVRCVNRTRKHAASVTAYSVLRACPSIQCSTPKLHQQTTGNVESEKGLKNYGSATSYLGLFPVSQSHKLIQNFLQSLEPPFLCAKLFRMENSKLLPQPVCLRIRDSWNGFLSTHSLFQCSEKYLSIRYARMSILFSAD